MSSLVICDVCNKPMGPNAGDEKLAVLGNINTFGSPKKTFDMHKGCYAAMLLWMAERREKSGKYKSIEKIRAGK